MKVLQINATSGSGSTGKICEAVSKLLTAEGIDNRILYSQGNSVYPLATRFADPRKIKLYALRSRILGNYGFNNRTATKKMLSEIKQFSPDIVHLHNIHSHDVHLEEALAYFKQAGTKLFWTFHDCWAFTGYCTYFTMAGCNRWQTGCHDCPQKHTYSWLFDRSTSLQEAKKRLFSGLDLTIITPSHWLAGLVKQSFLGKYPVKVIHNGIDLSVFKPTESVFRQKHGLIDQHLILGVAFDWDRRKGLDVFITLYEKLDSRYKIVLVGAEQKRLPAGILAIPRTANQQELAALYSAADVFVNPTREDNFPTVNIEALACGTPVVTFCTGGSAEMLSENSGFSVKTGDQDTLLQSIRKVCEENVFLRENCVNQAVNFSADQRFLEYLTLYQ